MENGKAPYSCRQAREIDIVQFLAGLGTEPVKIKGNNYWYSSPFRMERTPSFKVNRKINRWYDFGEGRGGDLIDLAIRLKNCTISELLHTLDTGAAFIRARNIKAVLSGEPTITVFGIKRLTSASLLHYLDNRRIPFRIADRWLKEINYTIAGRSYYAIGFGNDAGGWELRNAYVKMSTSPKFYTHIRAGHNCLAVFEGFMDFLSYLVLLPEAEIPSDFLVLNSLSFFEPSRQIMESYAEINLFLDNDKAGQNCSTYASSLSPAYQSQSGLYKNYNDLNDFLCGTRQPGIPISGDIPP